MESASLRHHTVQFKKEKVCKYNQEQASKYNSNRKKEYFQSKYSQLESIRLQPSLSQINKSQKLFNREGDTVQGNNTGRDNAKAESRSIESCYFKRLQQQVTTEIKKKGTIQKNKQKSLGLERTVDDRNKKTDQKHKTVSKHNVETKSQEKLPKVCGMCGDKKYNNKANNLINQKQIQQYQMLPFSYVVALQQLQQSILQKERIIKMLQQSLAAAQGKQIKFKFLIQVLINNCEELYRKISQKQMEINRKQTQIISLKAIVVALQNVFKSKEIKTVQKKYQKIDFQTLLLKVKEGDKNGQEDNRQREDNYQKEDCSLSIKVYKSKISVEDPSTKETYSPKKITKEFFKNGWLIEIPEKKNERSKTQKKNEQTRKESKVIKGQLKSNLEINGSQSVIKLKNKSIINRNLDSGNTRINSTFIKQIREIMRDQKKLIGLKFQFQSLQKKLCQKSISSQDLKEYLCLKRQIQKKQQIVKQRREIAMKIV